MKNHIKYFILAILPIVIQCTNQSGLPAGFPDRSTSADVLPGFKNPPKGYGEVPFYWWQGDTLTKERLTWQLDQLTGKGISSLQINYSHLDYGGLTYGLSNPSKPALFSEAWWDLFKWFAAETQKRGMTVSLSDYTIGIGQGYSMDEALKNNPDLNGSVLNYESRILKGDVNLKLPENAITVNAYKIRRDSSLITESRKTLLPLVKDGYLNYNFGDTAWKLMSICSERLIPSYDPMHPGSGEAYNKYFFEKFEEALPGKGSDALNFFFSDELNFRVSGNLWNIYFADEFKKRKGYDITNFLDAIFENTGPETPKVRLDYNDVIVSLSEENFFKPVYQWHQDRGMIFGCDHGGRGRDLGEFGDYFRTQRWNQGPGSDQPRLSKDIIKAKVAASISHLYNQPRVWLEGFHSSGWGTSSAALTDAIFANYVAGYNLMSFHGLYYSTMGGWWEWAPPCNHFRMPYWKQIDPLMNCIQRLSYLLSQGYHKCDVVIIYPTEPVIAGSDGEESVRSAFETGERLYDAGIDFDFIDYESLARCEVRNKELRIAGENYKVLIIPSMKVIRHASLKKLGEFRNAGGIIVTLGAKPEITELYGAENEETRELSATVFSAADNIIECISPDEVPSAIKPKYEADFMILSEIETRPYVMHRIIGKRDVYALYNFPSGSNCFFRARGNVQLWDPWNGRTASLSSYATQTSEGTEVELPLTQNEIQIIVFDPENTETDYTLERNNPVRTVETDNNWEFELEPYLDNQWGDYQLPSKNELLGAQVRQMYFKEVPKDPVDKIEIDASWKRVTCSFGTQFLRLGALPEMPDIQDILRTDQVYKGKEVTVSGKKYRWEEYSFSWKSGVEGDYGHQGYHGLKGKMYDNFIRLGAMEDVKMSKKRAPEPGGNYYVLGTKVIAPYEGDFELLTGDIKPTCLLLNNIKIDPAGRIVKLKKGSNPIIMVFDKACETYLVLRNPSVARPEKQPLAMCWYRDEGLLPFDCSDGSNSVGLFAFESAPALKSFMFSAYGRVKVMIDGAYTEPAAGKKYPDGLTEYSVTITNNKSESSQIVLSIEFQPGFRSGGAVPDYIEQRCEKGSVRTGDWSEIDGLRAYSGGAWYRKTIVINELDLKNRTEIDLGELVSSAELLINGKSAGIKLSPPWTFDITEFAKAGENRIEVLVYNTLANNYTSIPTRYRGEIKSGLIGPVSLKFFGNP